MGRISKVIELGIEEQVSDLYGKGFGSWKISKILEKEYAIEVNHVYIEKYIKTKLNPSIRREHSQSVLRCFNDSEKQLENLLAYTIECLKNNKSCKPKEFVSMLAEIREQLTLLAKIQDRYMNKGNSNKEKTVPKDFKQFLIQNLTKIAEEEGPGKFERNS